MERYEYEFARPLRVKRSRRSGREYIQYYITLPKHIGEVLERRGVRMVKVALRAEEV